MKVGVIAVSTMSEEQLSAFLAALKADAGLQEKLKGAADLDAAVAIAKDAGFDVSKADWLKAQDNQVLETSEDKSSLSLDELAGVSGGVGVSQVGVSQVGKINLGYRVCD